MDIGSKNWTRVQLGRMISGGENNVGLEFILQLDKSSVFYGRNDLKGSFIARLQKKECKICTPFFVVVPSGLEPELFWTKTRRVASYTTGQSFGVFSLKTVQKYKFFSFGSLLLFFFHFQAKACFVFFC